MNIEPLLEAFRRCFPEYHEPEIVIRGLLHLRPVDDPLDKVANPGEAQERLAAIVGHLNAALTAYHELPPLVRDVLDEQFGRNMLGQFGCNVLSVDLDENDELVLSASLEMVFIASLYSLTGKFVHPRYPDWEKEEQPGAVASAAGIVASLVPFTGKARAEETWEKFVLVRHAIHLWRFFAREAPDLSSSKFLDILQGLSDSFDFGGQRHWDAGDLVRSYRRSIAKLETENHK